MRFGNLLPVIQISMYTTKNDNKPTNHGGKKFFVVIFQNKFRICNIRIGLLDEGDILGPLFSPERPATIYRESFTGKAPQGCIYAASQLVCSGGPCRCRTYDIPVMSRMDYRCPNGPYKMSRLVCKQNRGCISKRDIGVI